MCIHPRTVYNFSRLPPLFVQVPAIAVGYLAIHVLFCMDFDPSSRPSVVRIGESRNPVLGVLSLIGISFSVRGLCF